MASGADANYFKEHGLEQGLASVLAELGKQKPADPYKFLAEALAKAEPKAAAGACAVAGAAPGAPGADAVHAIGDELRALKERLKAQGVTGQKLNGHAEVQALVARLAAAKGGAPAAPAAAAATAVPAAPAAAAASAAPKAKAKAQATEPKKAEAKEAKAGKLKKAEAAPKAGAAPSKGGGMDAKKAEDVPGWYEQVIKKAELIEPYPVKGCFTLRPWAYRIWELIQLWFDTEIKKMGVENCYFPLFIPKAYMAKEEAHLDDFAPELAWVTRSGDKELEEPVALRPTSETAMYAAYANWVQSHRDLPIKLNQWCNMIRWEVKQTTPFLRMRENLWQEGHTAYADRASAEQEVLEILELYARIYEDLLAIPVVRGRKTKAETFPGADYTTTVECMVPATGRGIQGATSHHLGQNFSKMFDISFQDPKDASGKSREHAYQNSWGLTTRTIGVMIMVHGDDRGLVLPPAVASLQVVIVPVGLKASSPDEERQRLADTCENYRAQLVEAGLRVKVDDREQFSPGNKFNHWEMKGVPIRIELGPADLSKGEFVMAKRTATSPKEKITGKADSLVEDVRRVLAGMHDELYAKALEERDSKLAYVDLWEEFSPNLNQKRLLLVPFCGSPACEEAIKEKSKEEAADEEVEGGLKMGAKSLCIPLEEKFSKKTCPKTCIHPDCKAPAIGRVMFGRSY